MPPRTICVITKSGRRVCGTVAHARATRPSGAAPTVRVKTTPARDTTAVGERNLGGLAAMLQGHGRRVVDDMGDESGSPSFGVEIPEGTASIGFWRGRYHVWVEDDAASSLYRSKPYAKFGDARHDLLSWLPNRTTRTTG